MADIGKRFTEIAPRIDCLEASQARCRMNMTCLGALRRAMIVGRSLQRGTCGDEESEDRRMSMLSTTSQ